MGFTDLVVEADLDLHDFAALVPVIEGAGGIITDWHGRELGHGSDGRVVAAGDCRVHAQALELLGQGACQGM
jgi:inositol-phosphate phosphatase/L-galactose 1-phosphate phosphatase/histidinol-phosphatase